MSDQPDPGRLPELSPEQETTVRRLLAEARHEEPIPVEVGARLDRVLADLVSDPSDRSAPVADLAAHRRRRNAAGLLVAAAAVIVGGFAVGQMIDVGGSDNDGDSAADSSVARDQSLEGQAGGAALSSRSPGPELAGETPLQLTSTNLKRDLESQLAKQSAAAQDAVPTPLAPTYGAAFSCASAPPTAYGLGKFFAAFYDGMPTVLALRPAEGNTQEAQVLDCSTGTPLRSVTVPAR